MQLCFLKYTYITVLHDTIPFTKTITYVQKPDVNTQHVNSITHVNYENNPIYKMRKESEQKKVT